MKTTTNIINDPIEIVVQKATTRMDRGALRSVIAMIRAARPNKRAALWNHFGRSIGRSVRFLIVPLRKAYDQVEAERIAGQLDVKSPSFNAREYAAHALAKRDSSKPLTVE